MTSPIFLPWYFESQMSMTAVSSSSGAMSRPATTLKAWMTGAGFSRNVMTAVSGGLPGIRTVPGKMSRRSTRATPLMPDSSGRLRASSGKKLTSRSAKCSSLKILSRVQNRLSKPV